MKPTREQAYAILVKYNTNEALINHALAVEAVMRHYAAKFGEDIEKWGAIGLLHDLDYQLYPEQHCQKVVELLKEEDVDEEYIRAVQSHGYGICTDVEPTEKMEKILYTIDEITGLINACAIMRPSKSVLDLELKSVKKKFKDRSFAAGVNREVIQKGAEMLDMPLDEIITETILGMRSAAEEIGLKGNL